MSAQILPRASKFDIVLLVTTFLAAFAGNFAVAFGWEPPIRLIASVSFCTLALTVALILKLVLNSRKDQ